MRDFDRFDSGASSGFAQPAVEREDEDSVKGPFTPGAPRLAAAFTDPYAGLLRSTLLFDREGELLFERDLVRPHPDFEAERIWWSQRHLRWEAGDGFSLAQLDALACHYFRKEELERVGGVLLSSSA